MKTTTNEKSLISFLTKIAAEAKVNNLGRSVKDRSDNSQTKKIVMHGIEIETIIPEEKPFVLCSGGRSGCDASILLEIEEGGIVNVALSHFEAVPFGRKHHAESINGLINSPNKGKRFALLLSGTLKNSRKASEEEFFQKITAWNNGELPDIVHVPFDDDEIEWGEISEDMYQLFFKTEMVGDEVYYHIYIPGTKYSKTFTFKDLQSMEY